MAGITQTQAETNLSAWLAASEAVASGQSYSIAGRTLTRADADQVQSMITFWDNKVKSLERGGIKVRGVTTL